MANRFGSACRVYRTNSIVNISPTPRGLILAENVLSLWCIASHWFLAFLLAEYKIIVFILQCRANNMYCITPQQAFLLVGMMVLLKTKCSNCYNRSLNPRVKSKHNNNNMLALQSRISSAIIFWLNMICWILMLTFKILTIIAYWIDMRITVNNIQTTDSKINQPCLMVFYSFPYGTVKKRWLRYFVSLLLYLLYWWQEIPPWNRGPR